MNPRAIPVAKDLVGRLADNKAREIASYAMTLGTAAQIEDYMKETLAAL
jgi:hypothetical protein